MSKFQDSLTAGHHKKFADMCGNWKGTSRTWFEPNVLTDESPVAGKIYQTLGGLFIIHEYTASLQGKEHSGLMIVGASFPEEKFQTAWIDSFHNGTNILFSEGKMEEGIYSVLGSYAAGSPDVRWGWRTTLEQPDADTLIMTMYNIQPGEQEAKAVEFTYSRVKE